MTATPEIDLTIRLTEAPGAPEHVFRLEAAGGALAEGCTLRRGHRLPPPAGRRVRGRRGPRSGGW